jgi:hypothetical protein
MSKKLDPRLLEILKQYGENAEEALWDCHGTWVAYHKAIERIATKAGVTYADPKVLVARPEAAAILVTGTLGEKVEWSIGEAAIDLNYRVSGKQAAYPFAMAEKRGKDRVVLKLIGLHGLVYSEEESDDFKPQKPAPTQNTVAGPTDAFPLRKGWEYQSGDPAERSSAQLKKDGGFAEFGDDLNDCLSMADLKWTEDKWSAKARQQGWPVKWKHAACDRIEGREKAILESMSPEHLADVPLDKTLKHSVNVLAGG